jgi:chromosome partitioning protein
VVIPVQCEYLALEGLSQLTRIIQLVRQRLNPQLEIRGLVLTMYDTRTALSHQVVAEVVKYFGSRVFATRIPRNVRLSEAPSHGRPALLYDVRSKGSVAYLRVAEEILRRLAVNQSAGGDR